MKKLLMIFILSLGSAAMADRPGVFRGTIECAGPYQQLSDPDFPPGSIRLRLTWDPTFHNTDVFLYLRGANLTGVTLLTWHYPGESTGPDVPYLEGTLRLSGDQSLWLSINRNRDRIPEGGPISEGLLKIDNLFRNMQCHEL